VYRLKTAWTIWESKATAERSFPDSVDIQELGWNDDEKRKNRNASRVALV
jgi:hypothetical protein